MVFRARFKRCVRCGEQVLTAATNHYPKCSETAACDRRRAAVIEELHRQAIEHCRRLGCTCDVKVTDSEQTFGPLHLPVQISHHADDCGVLRERMA